MIHISWGKAYRSGALHQRKITTYCITHILPSVLADTSPVSCSAWCPTQGQRRPGKLRNLEDLEDALFRGTWARFYRALVI